VFGGAPRVVGPSSTSKGKEKKEEGKSEEDVATKLEAHFTSKVGLKPSCYFLV
jgi:hypothetical protein